MRGGSRAGAPDAPLPAQSPSNTGSKRCHRDGGGALDSVGPMARACFNGISKR